MESPIKNKINIKQEWYLQWWDANCGFKQKNCLGSAHLLGYQKLDYPPNSATCKCFFAIPQKS
jgi:hypothetical protein